MSTCACCVRFVRVPSVALTLSIRPFPRSGDEAVARTANGRVLGRLNPAAPHDVVLVLDATTGQNALNQIEVFKETAQVTGLVMTKLDGTARGGVLVAAAEKYGLPIHAIGVGEGMTDLRPFDANEVSRIIAGIEGGRK